MTTARAWDFQTGLFGLVADALAAEGPEGAAIPVYDRARVNPPALFARIDSHSIVEREMKSGGAALHSMTVHLFHADARSRAEVKRLCGVLDVALRGAPIAGSALQIESTSFQTDDDGQAEHAMLRVAAWISPATA